MNLENLRINLIQTAQKRLQKHCTLGIESNLSVFEVAELKDIVSGNIGEIEMRKGYFFGLHSLN